ncbi:dihydrolipoyl dehydrogenase [Microbulbifer agarilyticus]|uniref:dihydrolipoyl dehydrogenase n=1 Tax=Microbulbifer agarilyticus TaxID=260552 RepID=UPI001CD26F8E|nr:dihydrolipoyl dehydrogenase [Microbulbifer agarilyticus]MCA0900549.1 dihydrolipoyl dehydrogenase [Microbulbifer agarilyticus]
MAERKIDKQSFDLVVVGAGPGGYVAAIRAAQLGMRVALVESQHLGGTCLNWGCIPTKSLLKSAEVYQQMKNADDYGLTVSEPGFDIEKIVQRSRSTAGRLSRGIRYLMEKNDICVFEGFASLIDRNAVSISSNGAVIASITAPHILLATGARPRMIPGVEADGEVIWTAREAMTPKAVPESLLIIGAGAIGIEFASFYSTFGSEVTVIEMADRILPQEDEDISRLAMRSFKKRGVQFSLGSSVRSIDVKGGRAYARWQDAAGNPQEAVFDRVIMAVGVVANTEHLGLEAQGIAMEKGQVVVNEWSQTTVEGIYAIGDMTAPPLLAHKASHEAVTCVERIAGADDLEPLDPLTVPSCIYSAPQVASVGLTESQAKAQGVSVRVGKFDLSNLGKAQAMGDMEGFVKTVFDAETGELLGAHMIGADVTELIQGYVIARKMETTEEELMETVFAHPTMSEAMHESVLDAYDRAIHH